MIFRQFLHAEPVAASYLFGCGGRGVCAVVDPIEDIGRYLDIRELSFAPATVKKVGAMLKLNWLASVAVVIGLIQNEPVWQFQAGG